MNEKLTEEQVEEKLEDVIDPEFDINIVDLGLLRDIEIDQGKVKVEMTLTSKGCPFHGIFDEVVTEEVEKLENVEEVETELSFDPPWDPEDMSDEARKKFGNIPGRSAF